MGPRCVRRLRHDRSLAVGGWSGSSATAAERVARLKEEVACDPAAVSRRRRAAAGAGGRRGQGEGGQGASRARPAPPGEAIPREDPSRGGKAQGCPLGIADRSGGAADALSRRGSTGRLQCPTAGVPDKGLISVAVMITDRRNDKGLGRPMVDEIARRYGRWPRRALFDEGYASRADIAALAEHPCGPVMVYAPPPNAKPETALHPRDRANRRYSAAREPQAVKDWRAGCKPRKATAIFRRAAR